jgi:hypothetical protein
MENPILSAMNKDEDSHKAILGVVIFFVFAGIMLALNRWGIVPKIWACWLTIGGAFLAWAITLVAIFRRKRRNNGFVD